MLDGVPVRSYHQPCIVRGRVMAPVDPFVIDAVASVEYAGRLMIARRGDLFAQTPAANYVAIGPLLRTLGLSVTYDRALRRVTIRSPRRLLALPTPFNPAVPRVAPTSVFTPTPQVTPRPIFSGSPTPRRTPLPMTVPTPSPVRASGRRADRGE